VDYLVFLLGSSIFLFDVVLLWFHPDLRRESHMGVFTRWKNESKSGEECFAERTQSGLEKKDGNMKGIDAFSPKTVV